jgi:hypothetical protein
MSDPLFKNDTSSQDDEDESTKHDGFDVFGSIVSKMNIWTGLLLFVLYILINTSFFVDEILKKINSDFVASDGNATSAGIITQGIFLSLSYIILDLLVTGGIL